MAAHYDIYIEWGENNCSAYAPSLPGCVTTGETVTETRARMREAMDFHLECLCADGDKIPRPKRGESGAVFLEIPADCGICLYPRRRSQSRRATQSGGLVE